MSPFLVSDSLTQHVTVTTPLALERVKSLIGTRLYIVPVDSDAMQPDVGGGRGCCAQGGNRQASVEALTTS
jgi:hypothetical protein